MEPGELLDGVLVDLDQSGRRLNAISEINWTAAQAKGRGEISRTTGQRPLAGIPYGIKDIFDSAGLATRYGAPPFAERVPSADAAVIERLRQAGAVLAAKLAPIQLAGAGGYRFPSTSLEGPGRNPWATNHWSGGSSSGSAIAVAAGIVPFSIGSETTGSVVVPAAFCGVTGFRPTWGAVSQVGMLSVAWSLDKAGIIARTAADCATVFRVIAGHDPRDPTTLGYRASPAPSAPWRIGVLKVDFDGFEECAKRFDEALAVFGEAGMILKPVSLPSADYRRVLSTIQVGETAGSQEGLIRSPQLRNLLDSAQRAGLRRSLRQPAAEYARASRERIALIAAIRSLFRRVDALVASCSDFPL
jgi:aspartyl-tRNA(Asn)/glutamyl-tRNA(Gln) amidotransferase subunit A